MRDRIKEAIANLNISANAFAVKADLDPSNLNKMLDGKQTITDKTIGKLCTAHNLSEEWIRNGCGPMMKPSSSKGNFQSPNGIYAEDSEIVIGDGILRERIKELQRIVSELQGNMRSWEQERKSMKKEIEDLRSKNESLNIELSKTKDRIIDLLMEHGK